MDEQQSPSPAAGSARNEQGADEQRTERLPREQFQPGTAPEPAPQPNLAPTQQFQPGALQPGANQAPTFGQPQQPGQFGHPGQQPGAVPQPPAMQFGQQPPQAAQPAGLNILGLISLIFGVITLVMAFFLPLWAGIPGLVTLVCGILGLVLKMFRAKKLMAILGVVLAVISIPIATVSAMRAAPIDSDPAPEPVSENASGEGSNEGQEQGATDESSAPEASEEASSTLQESADPNGEVKYTQPTVTDGVANIEVTFTTTDKLETRIEGSNTLSGADKYLYSEQQKDLPSPWTYSADVKLDERGQVEFKAEGWADNFRDVTCELKVDDQLVMRHTGSYTSCWLFDVNTKK